MAAKVTSLKEYVDSKGGRRVIRRILIANNGMAATKAILSMRQWAFMELGSSEELEFVAMASPDDLKANAEFIRLANSYVEVPAGKNCNNYANVQLILDIAKQQKVDAVWPGWGHASENPELPRTLKTMGMTFLGPNEQVMHALGDKIASTILAQSAGVPCIPWNGDGITAEIQADGSLPQEPFKKACLQSYEEALACSKRIGYPVVLKASEGGGGKGIRKANTDEELKLGWEQVVAEVVGSPIFMMQLCTGARHLEVQLVGDEHGDVIALSGRDCSTQRRFQKIFEEGPPTIAPRDGFRKAEQAAQRLAMSVGYQGAGTVEYLYKVDGGGFYFLELNPRLQVEHPVTEGITGVNMPALQLAVGMGIPLSRVPDIRRFYGLDSLGDSKIDFLNDTYVYPTQHVMAARITAENPEDGFRPTSGKIERVRFQSSPSVWGYFSVGSNGCIHEYADSQFGHIFAKGPTREHARKALQLALQNVHIAGDIRNPVEYLVELAETQEFRENTIDTAWLDRLIAEKSVKTKFHTSDAIFYAACFRSHQQVKTKTQNMIDALGRGHLPLKNDLRLLQGFQIEVAYDSTKYLWTVCRTKEDAYALTIGGSTFEAQIREQPDGSLYIKCRNCVTQVTGNEEPLGLRLRIEGSATITFPMIRDPSELRSEFNGKLVRYLHADGAEINEGDPFIELEAMKMIMSLRATSAGKIKQTLPMGAVVGAGELLATLELKDPSKVQMIKPFTGSFELSSPVDNVKAAAKHHVGSTICDLSVDEVFEALAACLNGYSLSPAIGSGTTKVVQRLFPSGDDAQELDRAKAIDTCTRLLDIFLKNETFFASLVGGDETQIKAKFTGEPQELLAIVIAHDFLPDTLKVVCSLLRGLAANQEMENFGGAPISADLKAKLEELVKLPSEGGYGEVNLRANEILDYGRAKPLNERRDEVYKLLESTQRKDLEELAKTHADYGGSYFGIDLISQFFKAEDPSICHKAVEVYIRRMYRGYAITHFEPIESKEVVAGTPGACFHVHWTFSTPGAPNTMKQGYAIVVPQVEKYESLKKSWQMPSLATINEVHILVADAPRPEMKDPVLHQQALTKIVADTDSLIQTVAAALDGKNCSSAHVLLARSDVRPTYLHYTKANAWKEVKAYRNLRSSFPVMMELTTLANSYDLTSMLSTRRTCVMLGQTKDKKTEAILVRSVSHQQIGFENFDKQVVQLLVEAFDMVERVLLDESIDQKKMSSRIFVHVVSPIPSTTDRDLMHFRVLFDRAVEGLTAHGSTLLKLRIDKVEVKVWVGQTPLLLEASQDSGWQPVAFKETIDPATGCSNSWTDVETGMSRAELVASKPGELAMHAKRKVARRDGSSYIYDFLSLFRIGLTQTWLNNPGEKMPDQVFRSRELVLEDGELVAVERPVGQNTIGMVAWECTMKTPEYPEGRDVIIIGNDLTIKAGSFGVVEDELFDKASKLARAKGIPRVYIACNSGARLGTVEELKKMVQIAWVDPKDLNKGFDYLYLTPEDMAKLPDESVRSHEVSVGGKTRHVLDAIMGLKLPSTKGGIGIENLQGSGLIAGETSRAYEETFTLSYVTGRSVGIGAYLNRLGQRNIQMVKGPMILTGFQALNKLLGQQVYTTQDQLGGPHIMVPNGVTHELVRNDQDGVVAILRWLAYVPESTISLPPMVKAVDPIDREVQFMPTKTPYDPRHMLAGVKVDGVYQSGFCDEGSFHEYMEGWGKTVIIGRGRVGGLPVGIVAVETRSVVRHIPADPADSTSHDIQEAQAGQVWFPDSAHKTAQAIRDFNRGENLPLIIFANWRGFSGGTRDMFAEVLKYGAMIVDALVDYKHPVTIYIPPNGELRGGAWVVLDPKINPDQMEMFADKEARGGILEPPAAAEIVFKRDLHVLEMMYRTDEKLKSLEAKTDEASAKEKKAREKLLLPMYRQVSVLYCDLHDRSARMKGLGAIHEELEWKKSRTYLHWRIRRRLKESDVVKRLQRAVPEIGCRDAKAIVQDMLTTSMGKAPGGSSEDDRAVAQWLESNLQVAIARVEAERQKAAEAKIMELLSSLPATRQEEVVRDLVGYTKVMAKQNVGKSGYP